MFYSHQLLARKASLGQIWMAATMHAKIHRKKLDKLNIIKICEEILNPSVPLALRLSGILMGGVVIVYERKVKLLFDDVTRLLVQINEAWKVKSAPSDPTRLPKNRAQAKHKTVTLPPNREEDLEDVEELLAYSNANNNYMDFQQTSYIAMRLDGVEDPYLNQDRASEFNHNHHQVDAADITLAENYDSFQADTTTFNRFERFDIEGDEDTQMNFSPPRHTEMPSTLPPSPPPPPLHDDFKKLDTTQETHLEEQVMQQPDNIMDINKNQIKQKNPRRAARKQAPFIMDNDLNIIPGAVYQSWLQNSSDLVSKRGRNPKLSRDPSSVMKMGTIMDLPSVVLMERLFSNGDRKVYYPTPLLETWMRNTQPHDSPSGRTSHFQPPEPSSSSLPERMNFMGPLGDPFEDHHSRAGSHSMAISVEKLRANVNIDEIPPEILTNELRNNLANAANASNSNLMATPQNSGDDLRSIPSSRSGNGFLSHNSDVNSGRSSKKRAFSPSKNSENGLEPVAEDRSWDHPDPAFEFITRDENRVSTLDEELLVETGPTQTQKRPKINDQQPLDHITNSIRMQLKNHFDTPGSATSESLDHLAFGMNKKRAACLFYQTCVLATRDFVKVQQREPYGEIFISRGEKM